MPIAIRCPHCGAKFAAANEAAGKTLQCLKCQGPLTVPMPGQGSAAESAGSSASASKAASGTGIMPPGQTAAAVTPTAPTRTAPAAPVRPAPQARAQAAPQYTDRWFVKTGTGEEYGPVTKVELDQWLVEERLDDDCQLLQEGWDQWKWASDVYPSLSGTASQPAVTPTPRPQPKTNFPSSPEADAFSFGQAYQSPTSSYGGGSGTSSSGDGVPPMAARFFRESSVWMIICAVGISIMLGLQGLGMLLQLLLLASAPPALRSNILGAIVGGVIGASLLGWVTFSLYGYIGAVNRLAREQSSGALTQLAQKHKSYWFACGLLMMIGMVLMLFAFLFAFALAGAAVRSGY